MSDNFKEVKILGLNPNETRLDLIPHNYVFDFNVAVTEAWKTIFLRKWKFYLDAKPKVLLESNSLTILCSQDELHKHLEYINKLFKESNEEYEKETKN